MKRFIITAALIAAIACASSFLYLHGRQSNKERMALLAFREGDPISCKRLLGNVEKLSLPIALYHSYLATHSGHFTESDYFLQTLLERVSAPQNDALLVQGYLTQALNAYFANRDGEITPLIDRAKQLTHDQSVLMFFEGLSHYLERDYGEAVRYWSAYTTQEEWMDALLEHCFPSNWRQLHIAHSLCEEGKYIDSREILEKESHLLDPDPHGYQQLATLFLGLTYLREAHEMPLQQRASYYKLARFYFDHTGREMRFDRERACVAAFMADELALLLMPTSPAALQDWGIAFVHTLEDWGAHDQIAKIATHLTQNLLLRRDEGAQALCGRLHREFGGHELQMQMMSQLLEVLARELSYKQGSSLCSTWHLLQALSNNSRDIQRAVSHLLMNSLLEIVHDDHDNLMNTRHFLAFWKQLGQERGDYESLGQQLLSYGQLFWQQEGAEEKGTHLLCLATEFCVDKQLCRGQIELFLSQLYVQAENSNMIHRLSLIHDALCYFDHTINEGRDVEKLANHLADAEYLYNTHNWLAAKAHASWVLKLDPSNHKAQRLVGLACFYLGEYSNALNHLQLLPHPDESVHRAIAFSLICENQEKGKHLVQIDNIHSFNEDE